MGPDVLVAPALRLGRSLDPGLQRAAAVRAGVAAVPGGADHLLHPLAGDVVREYAREDQFVTTCISYERRTVQDDALTAAWTSPQEHVLPDAGPPGAAGRCPPEQAWTTEGTWSLYRRADRMYLLQARQPFLVTETNAQAIGHAAPERARPTTGSGGRPRGRWCPAAPP